MTAPGLTPRRSESDRALAEAMLSALRAGRDVRGRKVRRLRAALKVRAYENPLKFQIALERLVAQLDAIVDDAQAIADTRAGAES